jgi:FG-GAP-like repeat
MIRTPVLVCLLSSSLVAQAFNNAWVTFSKSGGSCGLAPLEISSTVDEVDFASADLDNDGWTDLVAVRKEPHSTTGKRPNILLMNELGVFMDRTAEFASAADVPGDQGFLTPTNDRDVVVVDVDNDGWLDLVTSTAREMPGDPKVVGHPRVYMNLGTDGGGAWLGLEYQAARFPQLLSISGQPMNPVFCAVAAGDVTNDGFADLYFAHYDFSNNGFVATPEQDLNDRLLVNDGNGYFTDQSQLRMSTQMLFSRFGLSTEIVDINGDGQRDILKDTALANPYYVSASYNNPANPGFFNIFHDFHNTFSPYHIDTGDLNGDGRLDIIMGDDSFDRYRYNLGNDVLGRVIWGPAKVYTFLVGSDDGFAGQNLLADLDNDSWLDVLQADVDTDEPGLNRRLHVYHNPGGAVGAQITLVEERQQAGAGGWIGAVGFLEQDLKGTFDIAAFDFEGDGDSDVVLGRGAGTQFWINQTVPNELLTDKAVLSLGAGGTQTLALDAGDTHANRTYWILGSVSGIDPPVPLPGGLEIPLVFDLWTEVTLSSPNQPPYSASFGTLDARGVGSATFEIPAGLPPSLAGLKLHHCFLVFDGMPSVAHIALVSNPVSVTLVP